MIPRKDAITFFKKEFVLLLSLTAAASSFFFAPPSRQTLHYIDWRVLAALFCLMTAVAGMRKAGLLSIASSRLIRMSGSTRGVTFAIIAITFFASMAITNDVALITFVPIALIVLKDTRRPMTRIVAITLQTVAANLGSSLTPVGNPQNLYLFERYALTPVSFLRETAPLVAASAFLLSLTCLIIPNERLDSRTQGDTAVIGKAHAFVFFGLFVVSVLAVFRVVPMPLATLAAILSIAVFDRTLAGKIDYLLLVTFMAFFVCTGNLGRIEGVRLYLTEAVGSQGFLSGVLASQIISNVPAAILLSGFTANYGDLLRGVSVGGLGTLIASLASVISFKFFSGERPSDVLLYVIVFTIINVILLIVLSVFVWFVH
jgi:Na+/H+ antiporter NhaD/arsenite permease-like protein